VIIIKIIAGSNAEITYSDPKTKSLPRLVVAIKIMNPSSAIKLMNILLLTL